MESSNSIVIVTFYKFASLPDFTDKQQPLLVYCQEREIKGTILLAAEGINSTIAGSRQAIDSVMAFLRSDPRLADLEVKESYSDFQPFDRLKVKLKKEIVTLGMPEVEPSKRVGTYVAPEDWNVLIGDPEVTVIDTRNQYEVNIGTFKGAINPNTASFREFPDYVRARLDPSKHKKIALFCTGGIRCEKATSFMLDEGFEEVYHLKGGILNYLKEIPAEESQWEGECFVFDRRVALKEGLSEGNYDMCQGCGYPISQADRDSPHYEEGISCPHCFDRLTPEKRARRLGREIREL